MYPCPGGGGAGVPCRRSPTRCLSPRGTERVAARLGAAGAAAGREAEAEAEAEAEVEMEVSGGMPPGEEKRAATAFVIRWRLAWRVSASR